MATRIDRTGQRYGRLVAVKVAGRTKNKRPLWECICDCGTVVNVQANNLQSGNSTSCGCLTKEKGTEAALRHGHNRNNKPSATYRSWYSMRTRCLNPNDPVFAKYGGAGVAVCRRWDSFENFLADMGARPDGTTIDRIDGTKGYSPDNCRWATPAQQARNTKRNVMFNDKCLKDAAAEHGMPYKTVHCRIRRCGWDIEKALTTPLRRRKHGNKF